MPKRRKSKSIIKGHLEKVSAKIFDDYREEITAMIRDHQGLYALYHKNHLYYVGLATDLKSRINHHLRDRHQGKWSHFSLYIIRKTEHIKELESLLLRIAYPQGNAIRGKLKSENLRPYLKRQVKNRFLQDLHTLFDSEKTVHKARTAKHNDSALFKGSVFARKRIRATYKGKVYKAIIHRDGQVEYKGRLFDSPSAAGKMIRGGKETNGWVFWKIKSESGRLVRLSSVRK